MQITHNEISLYDLEKQANETIKNNLGSWQTIGSNEIQIRGVHRTHPIYSFTLRQT